jgi:hypothetical protein
VARSNAQRRDSVEARGLGRAGSGREVLHHDGGVECGRDLHESGRRTGVQAMGKENRDDRHDHGLAGSPGGVIRGRRGSWLRAEVSHLARETGASFRRDRFERHAEFRGDGRRDRAFDERSLAEQDPCATLVTQEVEGQLGREHGAAEIHQHEHAVIGPRSLDRLHDQHRVGTDRMLRCAGCTAIVGRLEPTGGLEPHLAPAHLASELGDALGDAMAVRDDHDADHVAVRPQALEARAPSSTKP